MERLAKCEVLARQRSCNIQKMCLSLNTKFRGQPPSAVLRVDCEDPGRAVEMAYVPHPQHRSAAFANQKSQWSIAITEEVTCYQTATLQSWACGGCYWGLHLAGPSPAVLGIAPQPVQAPLHIAKFVGDPTGDWHGYPVAHWLSPFDKPDVPVLTAWLNSGLISRPTMAKIHRGKRCAL